MKAWTLFSKVFAFMAFLMGVTMGFADEIDQKYLSDIASKASKASNCQVSLVDFGSIGSNVVARFRLENGLQIIVMEDHSAPVCSYQTWFPVGSRFETMGKGGIAHLFEHLMFKGTKRYPRHVFDRMLEQAGAITNAATWFDFTFYFENLPASEIGLAVELESDRMQGLVLDEEALRTELEVVKNERRLRVENDPEGIIEETVMREVFGTHPYGRPVLGTMEDLENITLDDCIAFYRTYYSPSNGTIVVVGDVKTEDVLTLVATKYGTIAKGDVPREEKPEKPPIVSKTVEVFVPLATERLILAFRGVEVSHPDSYALDCLNHILFDDESSRVYRELVERRKIASSVDGAVEQFQGDGIISVEVVMNTGRKAEEAVDPVMAKIREITEGGVTERELQRAKNFLEASFYKAMTTMGSRATQLALHHIMLGHYLKLNEYVPNIERVTIEDIQRVAKTYLVKERLVTVIARQKK